MSVTDDAQFMELLHALKHKSFAYEQSPPGDHICQERMNQAEQAFVDYVITPQMAAEHLAAKTGRPDVNAFHLAVGRFEVACWQYVFARDDCPERLDIDTHDLEMAEQEVIQRANELRH